MFKKPEGQHVSSERPDDGRTGNLPAMSLIAVGVIALIFLTYELVERLWLTETNMATLHLLHIIRGIGTSVLIGFLVGWYILRKGGAIFPSAELEPYSIPQQKDARQSRLTHQVQWFINMRWLACIISVTLIVVAIRVAGVLGEDVFWPLILSALLLAASNVLYSWLFHRGWLVGCLREIQIFVDLMILTVMLHYSGGIENPLFLIYIFHVIIGGILLDRRRCYAIVITATALFGLLAFLEMSHCVEHYTLTIFPHEEDAESATHAAHQPLYVSSMVGLQFMLMSLTAYFTTNIMSQLRAEERHARMEGQRLRRVLQASGAGFTILDRQLRPLWLNPQITEWLNLRETPAGQTPRLLTEWTGGDEGAARETLNDGRVRVVERHHIDSDGNKRFFQVTVAPLLDSEGNVYQVVELTQDITGQKLLEAEMMHSSKMAALGVMAAGVAHEVGNPLASISTRLNLLNKHRDEPFISESIELLKNEISRIGRILKGVSLLARPNTLAWNPCRINTIVGETLEVLRLDPRAKVCDIVARLGEPVPLTTGSRDELFQVFLNLGLNALEKMPQGGTLTVRTCAAEGEIQISFADTGEGMSKEVLSKMFTPFFTTKKQGLGLGLYMAHNIINAHNGKIEVQSKLGIGTVITVMLPVRATESSKVRIGRDHRRQARDCKDTHHRR